MLAMIKDSYETGIISKFSIYNAVRRGDLDCIKYFHEHGGTMDVGVCTHYI